MKTDLDNRQDSPDLNRGGTLHVKSIGPHEHGWEFYGTGNDGGAYQVCQLCGARRVVDRPLVSSPHRDWIEGHAEWTPDDNPAVVAEREKAETGAAEGGAGHDDEAKAAESATEGGVATKAVDAKPRAAAHGKTAGKKAD